MLAFIGMIILMGIHRLPQVRDYWSGAWGLGVSEISSVMPLYRFESIHHFLHVTNNKVLFPKEHPDYDKLGKVRQFLNLIQANFLKYYIPHQPVSVDESMTAFKGRSSIKQYMPKKPIKRGFKSWAMSCPLTGYTFVMEPYIGKVNNANQCDELLGTRVVYYLSQFLPPNPGYIIHSDRFFTNVELALKLLKEKIYIVGTAVTNRRHFPDDLKTKANTKHLKRGDMVVRQASKLDNVKETIPGVTRLTVVVWKDSQPINFISTAYPPSVGTTCERTQKDGTKITIPCPAVCIGYNKGMGGVDTADQLAEYYPLGHPTKKWWPRLMWRYLNTALVNAYLLFKSTSSEFNAKEDDAHKKFQLSVARCLIGGFCSRKNMGRPIVSPRPDHQLVKMPGRIQQCRQCMAVNKRKKKTPSATDSPIKRPRESTLGCPKCGVHLCRDTGCYELWHSTAES